MECCCLISQDAGSFVIRSHFKFKWNFLNLFTLEFLFLGPCKSEYHLQTDAVQNFTSCCVHFKIHTYICIHGKQCIDVFAREESRVRSHDGFLQGDRRWKLMGNASGSGSGKRGGTGDRYKRRKFGRRRPQGREGGRKGGQGSGSLRSMGTTAANSRYEHFCWVASRRSRFTGGYTTATQWQHTTFIPQLGTPDLLLSGLGGEET